MSKTVNLPKTFKEYFDLEKKKENTRTKMNAVALLWGDTKIQLKFQLGKNSNLIISTSVVSGVV